MPYFCFIFLTHFDFTFYFLSYSSVTFCLSLLALSFNFVYSHYLSPLSLSSLQIPLLSLFILYSLYLITFNFSPLSLFSILYISSL